MSGAAATNHLTLNIGDHSPPETIIVYLNAKMSCSFNVKSWEDWQSQIDSWLMANFPNFALVPQRNPWVEINADNYKLYPVLELIEIPDNANENHATQGHFSDEYLYLKNFIHQPLPKITKTFRDKINVENLNKEVNHLLYSLDVSSKTAHLTLIRGLVSKIDKIYGQVINMAEIRQVLNQWIVDLTSIAPELPQNLHQQVKHLFHQVFDSIMDYTQ